MKVLRDITCVSLNVTCWSGTRKLSPGDLKIPAGIVPPQEIASMGSLKLIDPATIQGFSNIRKSAQRACRAAGVSFMRGYAVANDRAPGLIEELNKLQIEFESLKGDFLVEYEKNVEVFANKHTKWADLIRSRVPTAGYIMGQLDFSFQVFRVQPIDEDEPQDGLVGAVTGLKGELLREVAIDAKNTLDKSFIGKDQVTRKALRPVNALKEKLASLVFLDADIGQIVTHVQNVIDALPKTGPIEGAALDSLIGCLWVLTDPSTLRKHAAGVAASKSQRSLLDEIEKDDEDTETLAQSLPTPPQHRGARDLNAPAKGWF
jgi:hypothetical protein